MGFRVSNSRRAGGPLGRVRSGNLNMPSPTLTSRVFAAVSEMIQTSVESVWGSPPYESDILVSRGGTETPRLGRNKTFRILVTVECKNLPIQYN